MEKKVQTIKGKKIARDIARFNTSLISELSASDMALSSVILNWLIRHVLIPPGPGALVQGRYSWRDEVCPVMNSLNFLWRADKESRKMVWEVGSKKY